MTPSIGAIQYKRLHSIQISKCVYLILLGLILIINIRYSAMSTNNIEQFTAYNFSGMLVSFDIECLFIQMPPFFEIVEIVIDKVYQQFDHDQHQAPFHR